MKRLWIGYAGKSNCWKMAVCIGLPGMFKTVAKVRC